MQIRNRELTRRSFLTAAGAASLAGLSCSGGKSQAPPNIVILMADDLGYGDLSSYGCPDIKTPHIDSIGTQGVRFSNFYANAPQCTPTRTALLTGRYQQRVGGLECAIGVGNVGRYDEAIWLQERGQLGLPSSELTMGQIFKNHGYDTACIGKWHLGYLDECSPNRHGFDEFFGIMGGNADYFTHREVGGDHVFRHNGESIDREGYFTDLIVNHSVEWLQQRSDKPFLLYLPFTAPHTPLQAPDDGEKEVNDSDRGPGDRATYSRMVESMDDGVGKVLAQIESMGAADNTLVIFKSDNGGYGVSRNHPFQGHKSDLWEGGIRAPAMMRWPGVIPAASETNQVGLSMDLLPTLLAAAGIAPPSNRTLDGVDLLPVIRGDREAFVRTVYFGYKRAEDRRQAVIHGQMKYLNDNGDEYLYNLAEDIHEDHSLIEDFPGVATELKDKLAAWAVETRAPRLAGFSA